jgi:hypothetical protein
MFDKPKQKLALKVIETLPNVVRFSVRYPKDKATSLQGKSGYINDCKNGTAKIGI